MNINEFVRVLSAYVESQTPSCHDGDEESLLEMLFNIYTELKGFDNQVIRKDFEALYTAVNGKSLQEIDAVIYPVCDLCRDHQKVGFIEGVKVGFTLRSELSE